MLPAGSCSPLVKKGTAGGWPFGPRAVVKMTRLLAGLHNGVLVHNGTAFWGPTTHKKIDPYTPETAKGPLALQDHGNPVRYRNIWIRPLKGYDNP